MAGCRMKKIYNLMQVKGYDVFLLRMMREQEIYLSCLRALLFEGGNSYSRFLTAIKALLLV